MALKDPHNRKDALRALLVQRAISPQKGTQANVTPRISPRLRPLLVTGIVGATVLALSIAAISFSNRDQSSPAERGSSNTTSAPSPSNPTQIAAVTSECGVTSIAQSIMLNAYSDKRDGRLTDSEYAAVLNTVAPSLLQRPKGLPVKVQAAAEHLSEVVGPVQAGHLKQAFAPRGTKVLAALDSMAQICTENGSPLGILATTGG